MIILDERTHTYTMGSVTGPSVTTVLKAQGLITVPQQAEADPYYREAGKAMHLAIHLDLTVGVDESSLDEDTLERLNRARAWLAMMKFKPLLSEHRAYDSATGTFGTWDTVGESAFGLLLPDFKRSSWQPGYDIQVAGAYAYMSAPLLNVSPYRIKCCTVPLDRDLPKAVIVEQADMNGLREQFKAAARNYAWRQQKGLLT